MEWFWLKKELSGEQKAPRASRPTLFDDGGRLEELTDWLGAKSRQPILPAPFKVSLQDWIIAGPKAKAQ